MHLKNHRWERGIDGPKGFPVIIVFKSHSQTLVPHQRWQIHPDTVWKAWLESPPVVSETEMCPRIEIKHYRQKGLNGRKKFKIDFTPHATYSTNAHTRKTPIAFCGFCCSVWHRFECWDRSKSSSSTIPTVERFVVDSRMEMVRYNVFKIVELNLFLIFLT